MKSVRLHKELEHKLKQRAEEQERSESDIIRDALVAYLATPDTEHTSYKRGKKYFGNVGSGNATNSETYKQQLKEKLREKTAG